MNNANTELNARDNSLLILKNDTEEFHVTDFSTQFKALNKRLLVQILTQVQHITFKSSLRMIEAPEPQGDKRFGSGIVLVSPHEHIKPGTIVIFNKWSGVEIKTHSANKTVYTIIKEEDICGTLDVIREPQKQ